MESHQPNYKRQSRKGFTSFRPCRLHSSLSGYTGHCNSNEPVNHFPYATVCTPPRQPPKNTQYFRKNSQYFRKFCQYFCFS